ncbi:hypothetical protein LGN13_10925 [Burkholderia multivorans]|nr:hypothetical protein [Burkholderia multivorans]
MSNDLKPPVEQHEAAPIHEPTIPDELHPDTAKLVRRFARALANKLLAAQRKYGYSDNWMRDGWADECRAELMRHIHKGDPRDVAAYCAFLWHHNESTAPAPADERAAFDHEVGNVLADAAARGIAWMAFKAGAAYARASSPNAAGAEGIEPTMPSNEVLTARVADLLHLLSFATIHTPSDGDEPQIRRALHDIKAMIAAAPASAPVGLTEQAIADAVTKWFPDRAYQAPFFARELLKGDKQ